MKTIGISLSILGVSFALTLSALPDRGIYQSTIDSAMTVAWLGLPTLLYGLYRDTVTSQHNDNKE